MLGLTLIGQTVCALVFHRCLSHLHTVVKADYHNPIMEKPYTEYSDDLSLIEIAMQIKHAELRAVNARARETASDMLNFTKQEWNSDKVSTRYWVTKKSDGCDGGVCRRNVGIH
ncbi:hypothetical protein [Vibrio toranzoniae]|uniref:hypothetical protein n=1 Tax=Vibrio toranzoniae TaxID=1194427 RepID=UPI001F285EB4|nr:hypothetical protein [Vibrio toranzoniae]